MEKWPVFAHKIFVRIAALGGRHLSVVTGICMAKKSRPHLFIFKIFVRESYDLPARFIFMFLKRILLKL